MNVVVITLMFSAYVEWLQIYEKYISINLVCSFKII